MWSHSVKQRKKDVRSKYEALVEDREKLLRTLRNKEELHEESERPKEDSRWEQQRQEEQWLIEFCERQQKYEKPQIGEVVFIVGEEKNPG